MAGFLHGGMRAWREDGRPVATLPVAEAAALENRLQALRVVDVRAPAEYLSGHLPGATNIPLDTLESQLPMLDRMRPTALVCASGYRSTVACSLLARAGFGEIVNLKGGTSAWREAKLPVVAG